MQKGVHMKALGEVGGASGAGIGTGDRGPGSEGEGRRECCPRRGLSIKCFLKKICQKNNGICGRGDKNETIGAGELLQYSPQRQIVVELREEKDDEDVKQAPEDLRDRGSGACGEKKMGMDRWTERHERDTKP